MQADDKFWKRKKPRQPAPAPVEQQDEPANADESATENEAEVELDSLGRLFIQLADAPSLQDEAEISHTNEPEVTLISSDSDSSIPIRKKTRAVIRKVRRKPLVAVRKVPFSHQDAHLDPKFVLKKTRQAGTSKRKTRSSEGELSGGLPYELPSRKARAEVLLSPTPSFPLSGHFKEPLHLNDSAYQTSPSLGESSATQAPAFNINPG
jgi:hypothetical protein